MPKRDFHKSRGKITPLEERDIITIDSIPLVASINAINFSHIVETGQAPIKKAGLFSGLLIDSNDIAPNNYIDFNQEDAFTNTLIRTEQQVANHIAATPELMQLLEKESWDKGDRVQWERSVSNIISDQMSSTPGLSAYRSEDGYSTSSSCKDVTRHAKLNDISADISGGSCSIEYDCEGMALVEGTILQNIEQMLLPDKKDILGADTNYKRASDYFFKVGYTTEPRSNLSGGHAYVVSSATGNIIEATAMNHIETYQESGNPDQSFEETIKGDYFISKQNQIYSNKKLSPDDISAVRAQHASDIKASRSIYTKPQTEQEALERPLDTSQDGIKPPVSENIPVP